MAKKNRYIFMESSCADNYNVLVAFTTLVEMTNNELHKGNKKDNIILNKKDQNGNQTDEKCGC